MDIFNDSIFSDVNNYYISNPYPKLNEQIIIKLRTADSSCIKRVLIRAIIDGSCRFIPMDLSSINDGFRYYEGYIITTQEYINYHFVIVTNDKVFYYNRNEVTLYPPTEDHDFVIISDFQNPSWVSESVFYQIFPDRFRQGNKETAVKDNEYIFDNAPSKSVEWSSKPLPYSEGHCLDFYGGDLYGIIESIPYFKELGVNALFLNPIFSARTHHRYDCTDYFSVDRHLGGNEALEILTKTLHENGIRLILDVSINHTGIEHPWAVKALNESESTETGFYYCSNKKLRCWMGIQTLPQLNYNSIELRNIMYKSDNSFTKFFLKAPYNIDGYRYDVGNNTGRNGKDQMGNEIFREVRKSAKSVNNKCYLIGEHWKDNISYLCGDQWDGAMNYFASSRPARSFAGENDRFVRHLTGKDGLYFTSGGDEVKKQIEQHFNRIPNQLTFLQFNLLDSHDVHRFHNNTDVFNFNIYRGIVIMLYMLPGTFSIYYGDEIGLDGEIDTIENARYPMEWDRNKWKMNFFDFYRILNIFKTSHKVLHNGSMSILYTDNDSIVISRFTDKDAVISVTYKGNKEVSINIPLTKIGINNKTVIFEELFTKHKISTSGYMDIKLNPMESFIFYGKFS